MFSRLMNSYYYGKSGKGDYRREDLPKNRWQLFWEMLRVRISGLFRINLMSCLVWLPMIIVLFMIANTVLSASAIETRVDEATGRRFTALVYADQTDEEGSVTAPGSVADLRGVVQMGLLLLIPCILITGPAQAGLAYVTRNWARDEHAFPWGDFKDAVKENWKQALGVSTISALLPFVLYICYIFYGQFAQRSVFFLVPQMLTLAVGLAWWLALVFLYPLMVSYRLTFRQLVKNGLMLAIARLPMTVGIRLCTLLPALIAVAVVLFTGAALYAMLFLVLYYVLIGNALTRFIYASFTNGVFDRYINSRIAGATVGRGLATEEDETDEEDEADENEPAT